MRDHVAIYLDFMNTVSRYRKANALRYLVVMRLLDPNDEGKGWLDIDSLIATLSETFGVKPKTALNNLWMIHNMGWGVFDTEGQRFFYKAQEIIMEEMQEPLTTRRAVHVRLEDIAGDIVQARAFFATAILQYTNKPISRKTRTTITGRSRTTQLKYDSRVGIKNQANRAALYYCDEFTEVRLKALRQAGVPAFVAFDFVEKRWFIYRRIPNSYVVDTPATCKRRAKTKLPLNRRAANGQRLFFESGQQAYQVQQKLHQEVFAPRTRWVNGEAVPRQGVWDMYLAEYPDYNVEYWGSID